MEYICRQKTAGNKPMTLTDQIQGLEANARSNLCCIAKIQQLSKMCGTEELDNYIEHYMHDVEKSILWLKAARSFLESI